MARLLLCIAWQGVGDHPFQVFGLYGWDIVLGLWHYLACDLLRILELGLSTGLDAML